MADIFKTSIEAGREARSRGQTGEPPGGDASLGVMADQIRDGASYRGPASGSVAPTRATAIAPPSAKAPTTEEILASISARPTRDPAEMEAEAQAAAAPQDPGITGSLAKGFKMVKVTWDFLANKLETAVTGDGSTTAPILQKSVEEYKAMASDPRIQEMIQLGNDSPDYYEAGKAMLTYAARNPGVVASFLAEQAGPVVASIPLGGVGGRVAGAAVARTALGQAAKTAVTTGATGASINSSAVVLGSLGTNYAEGLDKFNGDQNAAADYAATKTLAEVPANAVAGMFVGVNPFTRIAGKSATAAAVGNTATQIGIQGAGGGVGAYQAATSVGEDVGKGELLAEILGEGITGPIDVISARREAKAGITPPPSAPTQSQSTTPVTPAPTGGIVQDQDFSRLSPEEFQSAVESPAFMAAMYSRADEATRAKLQAATQLDLQALVQDGNLVMDGLKMMDSQTGPEFVRMFNDAVSQYKAPAQAAPVQSTVAPFDGGTTVSQGPNDFIPVREKMRMAQEAAQEGQMYAEGKLLTKEQADAKKAVSGEEKVEPKVEPSPLSQLSQAEAQIQSRFGLPSTINVADKSYVVEVGPTNKKRKDNSPVNALVSHKGQVIKIDGQAIVNSFDNKPWTAPKVEGVTALPDDAFVSSDQWLDFVFKHETAHISNKKQPGETPGAYENRINQIALTEVKGKEYADSIYSVEKPVEVNQELTPATEIKPAAQESNVAEGLRPAEATAQPEVKAEAKPKKKRQKRVKFQEIANETTVNPAPEPESKPSAVEKTEEKPAAKEPEPVKAEVKADTVQQDTAVPVQERTRVVEKPDDFVGPNKDRLYQEGDEKLDLTEKILEKYPYSMQEKMIARIRPMSIDEVRALWSKVSGMKSLKPKFEPQPNQFDDDVGGVMSNMARSGSMGLDAIAELKNKERAEAARRAQLEEEVRKSTKAMNSRAQEAAKGITNPDLKEIADTQQQEITGTTIDGFINPLGTVGVKPEFESVAEVTKAEIDAIEAQADDQQSALNLASAVISGEISLGDAKERARKEGFGTYNLVNAMRQMGVDPSVDEINQSGAVAANHTLNSYIRESGYSESVARELWLKSYDNLINKDAVELTKTEQAAYDNWKANRVKYKKRLSETVKANAESNPSTSLEEVFPNVLFTQFSLNEMRNPGSIDGPMGAVIKDLFEDPARAWFQDIKTVLTIRPDFEAQVMEGLTKDEQKAYSDWATSQLREAFRNADLVAKSPAYSQLDQLRFLSPEIAADFKTQIKLAEDRQLVAILHEAAEMNDRAKAAIEAGLVPDNSIDAQMREYMLRDEQMSKNPDEMGDEDGDGTALYKRGNYSGAVTALAIQEHLTNKFAGWDTKPEYTVAQNANQLPTDVRARLTSRFDNGAFKGALDPKTGHIYLFSDFMDNIHDAEFVMFHELYGHWGVRAFLGSKIDTFLENQYKLNKDVRETADRLRKEAAEMGMPMGKLESVEEAISDIAAKGDQSLFRQIIGKLTAWLRANGFDTVAKWMDKSGESELAFVLSRAKIAARGQGISPLDGAPSDIRYAANKLPVEVFATRDGKVTGYARVNPINGYWTVFTIENLADGNFSATTVEDYAAVAEKLKSVGTVIKAKDRATRIDVDPSDFVDIPDTRNITGWRKLARIAQIKAQNMYLPIFEVAEFLKRNGKDNSVIEDLKRYEGRTKYFIDGFSKNYQRPIQRLLAKIGEKGGQIDDVDLYLLARHAEERNKVIKNINPSNTAGSGMGAKSRTLADGTVIPGYIDVLRDSASSEYAAELEQLGQLVDRMSKEKVSYMLATGLITQNQADALNNYAHYVNLSGNEKLGLDKFDASVLGGRAFNLRGADAKRALGRGTLPVDILQNTMNSFMSTIIRGQKAIPIRAILDMIESNPDANFAVVEQVKETKRLNTEKLLADKAILKVIGDSATEVSGKQFLESLAFKVKDGQMDATEAAVEINERIREAEARRDIEPAQADAAIRRVTEEVAISGRLSPDGYVTMVEDPTVMNAPNVLVAKVDGKPVKIVFQEKGLEFVNAISGMSMQSRSDTLNAVGAWGRFFSQLVTSWNPAWVPVNGIRDFQTALSNMATDPRVGAKLAKEMAKEWGNAYRTAFRMQVADNANPEGGFWGKYLNSRSQKYPLSAEEIAWYEEFRKSGAETFFLDRKGLEETIETMNRHMNGPNGVLDWTKGKMEGVGAVMELMTLPMETAPRFAVYKTLRKNGWSIEDASVYAKELTVNFNLKGSSQWIRSLFVFANPSIQGTYRLFQDYSRGEKGINKFLPSNRFATVMGGWMMLGMLGNFLARGFGGEDDDLPGVDKLDQVPHHKRSTSFILAPDVPGMALPIGYGINFFFTLGHYLPDVMTGRSDAGQVAGKVLKTGFDAFAPIGSGAESKTVAGTIIKTVAPSIAVPLVELGMNENRFGAPISKQQSPFSDVKEANAYMHFDTANPISRAVMHGLNAATGGTRYKGGLIDVNPGAVDHLISSYLPGLVTEAYKGAGLAIRAGRGEEIARAPIPLVDRLTARVPEGYDAGAIRRTKEVVDTAYKELMSIDTTPERRKELRQQYPGLGAAKAVLSGTDQQIKQIRQQLEMYERDPRKSDDQKVAFRNKMKEAEKKIQNRAVNAALKAGFKNEIINE